MRGLLKAALLVAPALTLAELPLLNSAFITFQPPNDDGDTAGLGILSFRFDVFESNDACGSANVTINGNSLPEGGRGTLVFNHENKALANWKFTCVTWNGEAREQIMDLSIDSIDGQAVSDLALTVRFQQVSPVQISDITGWSSSFRGNRDDVPNEDPLSLDQLEKDLDSQLDELEFLRSQVAGLQEMILIKEQYLHETFGHSAPRRGGIRECDTLKCVFKTIYETVSETATTLYGDVTGAEGKRPCKRPNKKFPHHGWPHRGNHSHCGNHTHGNHTFPHPPWHHTPPHRFHPPPFCRCPPPPGHGPHGPPPLDTEFGKIPSPPDGEPGGLPPPPPPPDRHHGKTHGIRPPPPPPPHRHDHGPPHGPPPHRRFHHLLHIAVGAAILFILVRVLHKRCAARRQARRETRRKRCQAKLRGFFQAFFLRHVTQRPSDSHYGGEEEKAAMLPRAHTSTMEEELASCRIAAGVVGDMVAAEEGRAQGATPSQTGTLSNASSVHYTPLSSSAPSAVVGVGDDDDDEALPAYDGFSSEQSSLPVVADRLRYTPGSSECEYVSSSVAGDEVDTKH